jgi:hypothetical protein
MVKIETDYQTETPPRGRTLESNLGRGRYTHSDEPGVAYAFFDSSETREVIERNLPMIREKYAKTPAELELSLSEGREGLTLDDKLQREINIPRDYRVIPRGTGVDSPESRPLADTKYVLQARYPGASNEKAADELAQIVNFVSWLDQSHQPVFRGAVLFEKEGHYVFRE